jgi:hypothetical protein
LVELQHEIRGNWLESSLNRAERDAILEAAAAIAEKDYRNDPDLTAFEAYGKDDLYGESASTETR